MTAYLSPGVYTRETDFSFYIKQISTSACGMIGVAEKGPVNKPTLVTSWEQFTRKFGSYIADGYLAYAARAFFDNGGGVLWVTRIAHATDPTDPTTITATAASVTLKDRHATPVGRSHTASVVVPDAATAGIELFEAASADSWNCPVPPPSVVETAPPLTSKRRPYILHVVH
jgi:hypothetical protein